MYCRLLLLFWTFGITLVAMSAAVVQAADLLPEGLGLSAKYVDDQGIGKDPAILLTEDFERGDVSDLEKTWHNVSNKSKKVISFHDDSPSKSAGRRCIQLTATVTENEGGHLYQRLPKEVDTAFARFYVKFPEEAGYIHHFVHLGGYHPATNWPQGGAGIKPRGDDRMTVGIEPFGAGGKLDPPGAWNFYPYWHEMKPSRGNKYWGNSIQPPRPALVPRGQWQCVEMMMKANTPGKRDGELALWLDGKLAMHVKKGTPRDRWTGMGFRLLEQGGEPFEGFSWRTTDKLKINFFWLLHYVTATNQKRNAVRDSEKSVVVWFDNIVVSHEYVGPINAGK